MQTQQKHIISASILSADFARLGADVNAVLCAGADWVHVDVMDNHYVPNLTFGPLICRALRDHGITAPLDVHLMVKPVDALILEFAKAGATAITIHPESTEHLDRSLQLIREQGCQVGVALNPATPLSCLDHVLQHLDLILVMSVNPGFGGQTFIPGALKKITAIRKRLTAAGRTARLSVDGGVNTSNIATIAHAGADSFVLGSGIFNTPDYNTTLQQLRQRLTSH